MTVHRATGQSRAWNHGFDWAIWKGPHRDLGCSEAIHAHGYAYDGPEAADFEKGVDFAQNQQMGEDG